MKQGDLVFETPISAYEFEKRKLETSHYLFLPVLFLLWGGTIFFFLYRAFIWGLILAFFASLLSIFCYYISKISESYIRFQIRSNGIVLPWKNQKFIPFSDIQYVKFVDTTKKKENGLQIVTGSENYYLVNDECGDIKEVASFLEIFVPFKYDTCPECESKNLELDANGIPIRCSKCGFIFPRPPDRLESKEITLALVCPYCKSHFKFKGILFSKDQKSLPVRCPSCSEMYWKQIGNA